MDLTEGGRTRIDLGAKFNMDIAKLCNNNSDHELRNGIKMVKVHCHKLLDALLDQVKTRIPASQGIFSGLKQMNPNVVLNQVSRLPFKDLPMAFLMGDKISQIEDQYRKILHVVWNEEDCFQDGIPKESAVLDQGVTVHRHVRGPSLL